MDAFQSSSGPLRQRLLGPGRLVLVAFRFINIITLVTMTAASWILIIMFFLRGGDEWHPWLIWDLCSLFVISFSAVFFIVSEVADFFAPLRDYFAHVWPVLSDEHGFVWLGTAFLMMGFNLLSHLNNPVNHISSIGLALWRAAMAGGISGVVVGSINMLLTALYAYGNLRARAVRGGHLESTGNAAHPTISAPTLLEKHAVDIESMAGFNAMPQRPEDVHPAYMWRTESMAEQSAPKFSPAPSISHVSSVRSNPKRYSPAAMSQFFGPADQAASSVAGPYDDDLKTTTLRPPPSSGTYDGHPATRQNFI